MPVLNLGGKRYRFLVVIFFIYFFKFIFYRALPFYCAATAGLLVKFSKSFGTEVSPESIYLAIKKKLRERDNQRILKKDISTLEITGMVRTLNFVFLCFFNVFFFVHFLLLLFVALKRCTICYELRSTELEECGS